MQQWLSSAFKGHQRITDHPINTHAINLLYDAAFEAKRDEARFQLVAQGYRQRAEEYKAEGTFVCSVHASIIRSKGYILQIA